MAARNQNKPENNETEVKEEATTVQAEAPAQNQENNPADERIKQLEDQLAAMQELLKQTLGAVQQAAEKAKDEPKAAVEVTDALGVAMDEDKGTEWEEYETVVTPRARKGQEKSIVVSVNDRNVQIPLDGRAYRMRKPHAEIFKDSMEAEAVAEDFADNVPNEAAPASYEQLIKEMADLKRKLQDYGVNV